MHVQVYLSLSGIAGHNNVATWHIPGQGEGKFPLLPCCCDLGRRFLHKCPKKKTTIRD